jgi:isopentenyl-diphosphate delta-isomerase
LTADVSVTPNNNEIQAYKYVDKAELQAMFQEPGKSHRPSPELYSISRAIGNLFTPWFKLIARDFLFGWWDELHKRKGVEGKVVANSLAGLVDGSKVVKMD